MWPTLRHASLRWYEFCFKIRYLLLVFFYRLPFSFITNEVAEATCQCMLAQAEEVERNGGTAQLAERMILEEFGRCLLQVIHSAGRTRGSVIK